MFRHIADSSQNSDAWVKCGRCKKVFDSVKNRVDPTAFLKPEQETDSASSKSKPKNQIPEADSGDQPKTVNTTTVSESEKTDVVDLKTKSESKSADDVEIVGHSKSSVVRESIKLSGDDGPEQQLSFIESKQDKNPQNRETQAHFFNVEESVTAQANQSINKHTDKPPKSAADNVNHSPQITIPAEDKQSEAANRSLQSLDRSTPEKSVLPESKSAPSLMPTTEKTLAEQQKFNAGAKKKRKAEKSQWTKTILAQAHSWKTEKNRSRSRRSYTGILAIIGLLALLIWQVAIVNYTKLANYSFLSGPLNLTCAIFSCNQQQPVSEHEFEILHANLRRHTSVPGVVTVSANLINYSNVEKLLPTIRLDLTDDNEAIVASKSISLVDNPQYIDPAISQLAPGQDVKLKFDIDRPVRTAVGFEISIID